MVRSPLCHAKIANTVAERVVPARYLGTGKPMVSCFAINALALL
jgi:hypothetical protein